jgi:hypothetical protein
MDGSAVRSPRYTETAEVALGADVPASARKALLHTMDLLLAASDREQLMSVLEQSLSETIAALRMVNLEIKFEELVRNPPQLLRALQNRGVDINVVERVRLGLLAADDEAALLGSLPGGLNAHGELEAEDAKGRLLLMAIAKWAYSDDPVPVAWTALTFEFLDTAGRAFGIASSIISKQLEDVA